MFSRFFAANLFRQMETVERAKSAYLLPKKFFVLFQKNFFGVFAARFHHKNAGFLLSQHPVCLFISSTTYSVFL